MSDIVDITEKIKENQGPWYVLQDPYTGSVHVVHLDVIEKIIFGEFDIGIQDCIRVFP